MISPSVEAGLFCLLFKHLRNLSNYTFHCNLVFYAAHSLAMKVFEVLWNSSIEIWNNGFQFTFEDQKLFEINLLSLLMATKLSQQLGIKYCVHISLSVENQNNILGFLDKSLQGCSIIVKTLFEVMSKFTF